MRVAMVHDWLTGMRGGERVLLSLLRLFPDADLHTLLCFPDRLPPELASRPVKTTFVQHLPGVRARYRYYLPLFPRAIESFDFGAYDLVLSSSHCVAKAARAAPNAIHVSYVHTPMRYAWGMLDHYFPGKSALSRGLVAGLHLGLAPLRRWDRATAGRVDHFIANSRHVAERIRGCYGREATVVHPPVDISRFRVGAATGDYYLVVSALVPYKRVDLAIEACSRARVPLLVVGEGPERQRLEAAAGSTVQFLGRVSDEDVAQLYRGARGLLFPGIEDLGIVPLEAMASGCPVVAYREGGARETVVGLDDPDGRPPTGVLFGDHHAEGLLAAMQLLEARRGELDPQQARTRAEAFDDAVFSGRIAGLLQGWVPGLDLRAARRVGPLASTA